MVITFSISLNVVCLNWKHYDILPLMDIGKKNEKRLKIYPRYNNILELFSYFMSFNFKNPSKLFSWFYSLFCPIYGKSYYKELLKAIELTGSESILDFGSGAGVLAKKIVKELSYEGKLTCLDRSDAFLKKARKKLRKYTNVDFIWGDIREVGIPSNTFDIITISWVIHHLPKEELPDIIQSIVNALKSNGKVYVIEFLALPHGIAEEELFKLFNGMGLSESVVFRKKKTGIFEFKKK